MYFQIGNSKTESRTDQGCGFGGSGGGPFDSQAYIVILVEKGFIFRA